MHINPFPSGPLYLTLTSYCNVFELFSKNMAQLAILLCPFPWLCTVAVKLHRHFCMFTLVTKLTPAGNQVKTIAQQEGEKIHT